MKRGEGMHKILIIDDEPALGQTLAAILKRTGYLPDLAVTGEEGMQKLRQDAYSLLFLDIKLPDVTGIDLLPQIHQIDPGLPVVILTAHATVDAAVQAVREGARDFLLKPIDPNDILMRVEKILKESQRPQRQREIISQMQGLLSELRLPEREKLQPDVAEQAASNSEGNRFIKCGRLVVDLHTRHLMHDNVEISFPSSSFDYLVTLMRKSPEAVSFEDLVKESQGFDCERFEARNICRWHIHQIRKVLEQDSSDPHLLITVRNFGYRLVP